VRVESQQTNLTTGGTRKISNGQKRPPKIGYRQQLASADNATPATGIVGGDNEIFSFSAENR